MYFKDFEVRWSDLDANRHLANSAYINFMSHTRMAYMYENGLTRQVFSTHNLGPVVFYEHMYYFKEVLPGQTVRVSIEIKGLSLDGMFFEFHHNFYDGHDKNLARCEMMGGWIDLHQRSLTPLPSDVLKIVTNWEKAKDFRVLTKEDTS
jgi:acyl-CoA thioester hydrolase